MSKFVAFLRAINVGGHVVKMERLRQLFEEMGFSNVETFIASGNLVFQSKAKDAKALEKKIESKLQEALGYEVATFIRTDAELADVANFQPFQESATALNIAFLSEALDDESARKIIALKTDIDDFHIRGREVYWLCRKKQSESAFSNAVLEKTLKRKSTLRGANTIKKMAEKYAP